MLAFQHALATHWPVVERILRNGDSNRYTHFATRVLPPPSASAPLSVSEAEGFPDREPRRAYFPFTKACTNIAIAPGRGVKA